MSDRQFSLRSLFVAIAVLALPLALLHYYPPTLESVGILAGSSGVILAIVVGTALLAIAPLAAVVTLAVWWNGRSQNASFGGLVLRLLVICVVLYELLLLVAWLLASSTAWSANLA
jgi:hypothetical protein